MKNLLLPIFFRFNILRINSLVIYLTNAFLSRNVCQKSVRLNFRNFHTVHSAVWKLKTHTPQIILKLFLQTFRENKVFTHKEITKGLTWRNVLYFPKLQSGKERNSLSHSVVKWKIYSHRKNISSNHLFSDFFSKNVVFTRFLPKMRESEFVKLPHHSMEISQNHSHADFFRQTIFVNFLPNLLWKMRLFFTMCELSLIT